MEFELTYCCYHEKAFCVSKAGENLNPFSQYDPSSYEFRNDNYLSCLQVVIQTQNYANIKELSFG